MLDVSVHFCYRVCRVLAGGTRGRDDIGPSLDWKRWYNPLESTLGAYSLLNQLCEEGSVPAIGLHGLGQVRDPVAQAGGRQCDLQDTHRTAQYDGWLDGRPRAERQALDYLPEVRMTATEYASHVPSLPSREWESDDRMGVMRARADTGSVAQLNEFRVDFELRNPNQWAMSNASPK